MENSYIAQISTSNDCLGSGFIYSSTNHYYIFTAKHVICGRKNEYVSNYGSIYIKYANHNYNVSEDDIVCVSSDDIDLAIIVIEQSKLSNIASTPRLCKKIKPETIFRISGYPRARENKNILSVNACSKLDNDNNVNQVQLEVSDPLFYDLEAGALTEGYSGSGVFYENKQGVFALALMYGYIDSIKRVFCVNWNSVNAILEQNSLPLITFKNIEYNDSIITDISTLSTRSQSLMARFKNTIGDIYLDRAEIKSSIKQSLKNKNNVIIHGDAGTGKSAAVKDILYEYEKESNCYILAIKADILDKESLNDLSKSLGMTNPIETILNSSALDSNKILYIDSAEQLLEAKHWDTVIDFINIVSQANDCQIVVSARSYSVSFIQTRLSQSFAIHKIDVISSYELSVITEKYESIKTLSENKRIDSILKVPFYLDYITKIENINSIDTEISDSDFREHLWDYIIKGTNTRDRDIRSDAFFYIAKLRAVQMQPFADVENAKIDRDAIRQLVQDGLVIKECHNERYAPAHDILEDMALCRHVNSIYNKWQTSPIISDFYEIIGTEPSIRRAYRLWIAQKLEVNPSSVKLFIEQTLNSEIEQYWIDELLLVILRSNIVATLLAEYCSILLANNEKLLRRCILLMRVACKEPDAELAKLLNVKSNIKSNAKYFPMDFLKPSGDVWRVMANIIFEHRDRINIKEKEYIRFILDWSEKLCFLDSYYPIEARCIGLCVIDILNSYKEDRHDFYKHKELIKVLYKLSGVVRSEASELILWAVENNEESYLGRDCISLMLKDQNWIVPSIYIHKAVISLLRSSWLFIEEDYLKEISKDRFHFRSKSREEEFGFKDELSILNMGALGTPMYSLLSNHLWDGIRFVIEILNHSIDVMSINESLSSELVSINIEIDGTICNQKGSQGLWLIYRGATAECEILSSILMALEKVLLDHAQYYDKYDWMRKGINNLFTYILTNCRNVASTSVIASVLMAYPKCWGDKLFSLLKIKEFYDWDLSRFSHEISIRNYSTDSIIAQENKESNSLPHRQDTLENLMLKLSLDNQNRSKCFEIIDGFIANKDKGSTNWSIAIERMDLRRRQITQISEDKVMLQTEHSPEIAEHIEEFNIQNMNNFLTPISISNWSHSVLKGELTVTFKEWDEKLEDVIKHDGKLMCDSISFAGVGVVFLWDQLKEEQRMWSIGKIKYLNDDSVSASSITPLIPSLLNIIKETSYINDIKILILNITLYYQSQHMLNEFYASLKNQRDVAYLSYCKSCLWGVVNHLKNMQIDDKHIEDILNNQYSVNPDKINIENINQVISILKMIPNESLSADKDIQIAISRVNEIFCNDILVHTYRNRSSYVDSKFSFYIIYANYLIRIQDDRDRLRVFSQLIELIHHIINKNKFNHRNILEYCEWIMCEMVNVVDREPKLCQSFWKLWNYLFKFSKEHTTKIFIESLMFEKICTYPYLIDNWTGMTGKRVEISECLKFANDPLLSVKLLYYSGFDELLPYALPDLQKILINNNHRMDEECMSLLEKISFKLFMDSDKRNLIKRTKLYSDSFINILDMLISNGSTMSFIVREDFIATLAR